MLKDKLAALVGLPLLTLLVVPHTYGQGLGNSPYSRIGIGDANPNTGGVRQQGMGGVGLAAPNSAQVNELNPALLYYTARTTYEVGVKGSFQTVRNQVSSQRNGSGSLDYLALAVPLSKRWAAGVGLKPYTAVNYDATVLGAVKDGDGNTIANSLEQYRGTGGLSEVYLAQGFRVAKGLSVGLTGSYVFGNIDDQTATSVLPVNAPTVDLTKVILREQIHYSDFTARAGVHYRGSFNEKINYNLAGTYRFAADLNGSRTATLERENAEGQQVESQSYGSEVKGEASIPAQAQLGISFDNNRNWSASVDVAQQDWSKFRGLGLGNTLTLNNTVRLAVGGELTPDPASVENYFRRITYRAGLSVAQLPYRPAGQTLYDRAVSWGFSFPLPSATPLEATTMMLAFTYGQRGNTERNAVNVNGNVKEDYIRMQLGVTLNNRWFIKRRIE
ncbi:outer membrane protein transport protein [Hymenobacter sp. BT175]|uniref:OmpP1/FadL family transporter n=1 Tax=Hymenobacter translucens TaxID=2886507 RepID=UPI001D0DCD52|nr:outer membrane protein transport protein [Hymenobacter translucens]MCC2545759.1 outer membrane protein transport protein [Hymenobacter translucens]